MDRAIIHLNIADFAVAVETGRRPGLKGYPLIIAPLGSARALVYDMSDSAYQEGVRKGMPLDRARRMVPKAPVLAPCFDRYAAAMQDLFKQALAFSPRVEHGVLDGHLFMDVTASTRLFGPPSDVAATLRKQFKTLFGLDPIWSVATSRLTAKAATRVVKPLGECVVRPGDEETFLGPLSLDLIPGLEGNDLRRLRSFNLFTVSQARALAPAQLRVIFPDRADRIYHWLRGIDPEPVAHFYETRDRVCADHEFATDTNRTGQVRGILYRLSEILGRTLRNRDQRAATLSLRVSHTDGSQKWARSKLTPPAALDQDLFKTGVRLLERAWTRRVRIRHLRLTCDRLGPPAVQADLFVRDADQTRSERLIQTVDRIRDRFGQGAIRMGLTLENGG